MGVDISIAVGEEHVFANDGRCQRLSRYIPGCASACYFNRLGRFDRRRSEPSRQVRSPQTRKASLYEGV